MRAVGRTCDDGWRARRSWRSPKRKLTLAAVLGGAVALAWWVNGANLHEVSPGQLYRRAQPSGQDLERLRDELGIRSVVNLRGQWLDDAWYREEHLAAERLGLDIVDVDAATCQQMRMDELRKLVDAYDTLPRPILVHCRHGADRTSLAVALFSFLEMGDTPERSLRHYGLKYRHFPFAYGNHLRHTYDGFADWCDGGHREPTPKAFRAWIAEATAVGQHAAQLRLLETPPVLEPGETGRLRYEVANISEYPWTHDLVRPERGVCCRLVVTAADGSKTETTVGFPQPRTEPGATQRLVVEVTAPAGAGPLRVGLFPHDSHGMPFHRIGVGGSQATVEVQRGDDAAAGPTTAE